MAVILSTPAQTFGTGVRPSNLIQSAGPGGNDKWSDFRATFGKRQRATQLGKLTEYRKLVRVVADGGTLSLTQLDLLDEIASFEGFNPVDDFMRDVEALKSSDRLTEAQATSDKDNAKYEAEAVRLTSEITRLTEALRQAEIDHRQTGSQMKRIAQEKATLAALKTDNPRLFDESEGALPEPPAPAPRKSSLIQAFRGLLGGPVAR